MGRCFNRWPTRKKHERMRAEIAEAGSVSAWIRAGKPSPEEDRARKAHLNALARKFGLARPYPEVDECPCPECDP